MQKSFVLSNLQMTAVGVELVGIILVLVGGLITYAHAKSGLGIGLFWAGWALLIIALIAFVLSMRKQKIVVMNDMQLTTIGVDLVGIILVLLGGLITYAHAKSGLGIGLFWVGWVLLIIALIAVVLSMRKTMPKMSF